MRHASSCRARRPREDAGGDDDDDDGARADGMMHAMRRGGDLEWLRDPKRCTANVLAAQAAERERAQAAERRERAQPAEAAAAIAAAAAARRRRWAARTRPRRRWWWRHRLSRARDARSRHGGGVDDDELIVRASAVLKSQGPENWPRGRPGTAAAAVRPLPALEGAPEATAYCFLVKSGWIGGSFC